MSSSKQLKRPLEAKPRMYNELTSRNEQLLEPLQHYGPVTALKIYQNFVIAGYGPILKIFDQSANFKLILSQQVFKRNKIHSVGVSHDGKKLFVGGGRSFSVIDFDLKSEITEHAINEWIICGEFLDEKHLLILTTHNIIYKIEIETYTLVEKIDCNEKSILYSGSICITEDKKHIYIAAGTVMSGVLIWDFHTRTILYNLTEHEGSIFGVQIDSNAKHIISCSDDRSIKLYDFETGALLSTGWGHGSRIWNLCFYQIPERENILGIFSTGEDCTARLWEYDTVQTSELLSLVKVMDCHLGKHVWSGDIVGSDIAITGGADGRIIVHDISPFEQQTSSHSMDDLLKSTKATFAKKELIKQFVELPKLDLLVVLTTHGQFFSLNQTKNEWKLLSDIPGCEIFNAFGIMKAFVDVNVVTVVSRDGTLLFIRFDEDLYSHSYITETHLGSNKVANLFCTSNPDSGEFYVLVDCPNPRAPLVLRTFDISTANELPVLKSTTFLTQPEQLSFTTTSLYFDSLNKWLVLGSRYVSVAIYDLNSRDEENGSVPLSKIFKKLSIGDTVTSVTLIKSNKDFVRLCITVRDGVYMYADIIKTAEGYSINIIHHNKISKGFVEGGFVQDNDLILYGFKSSYFYVYNESQQLEITSELCGGSHRQWEFINYVNNPDSKSQFKFVYINKSEVHIKCFKNRYKNVLDSGNIINYGTHGREVRDVAISPFEDTSKESRLILTASEDTIVRLGRIYPTGEIKSYWCLNGHISGLQKVRFLSKEYAASSAANEEFCLWKIDQTGDSVPKIIEYARLKPTSSNPDLRIMDFDFISKYAEDGKTIVGFFLCTVYSDSMINVWYFDNESKSFHLIIKGIYTTCCILNVNFIQLKEKTILMTGATDGHLALWDITSQLFYDLKNTVVQSLGQVIVKQQIHQSGIKGLSILTRSLDKIEVVTGGDDNALILSDITFAEETDEIKVETKSFVEKASSTTITSISNIDSNNILVTSVDQIIRRWEILNEKELSCTSARYTTVADTGCSDSVVLSGSIISVIGGAGLSSWNCK